MCFRPHSWLIGATMLIVALFSVNSARAADQAPLPRPREIVLRGPNPRATMVSVESIDVSPDGRHVATIAFGYEENGMHADLAVITLWDAVTGKTRFKEILEEVRLPTCGEGWRSMRSHYDSLWQVAFSPDGRLLFGGCLGCRIIRVWDVSSGKIRFNKELGQALHNEPSEHFRRTWFSPDSRILVLNLDTYRSEPEPEVWFQELVYLDTTTWRVRSKIKISTADVYSTMLRPDGKTLLIASREEPVISAWDVTADPPRVVARQRVRPEAPDFNPTTSYSLIFAPDGSAAADDGGIRSLGKGEKKSLTLERIGPFQIDVHRFSSDGRLLAGCGFVARPTLWGLLPETARRSLDRHLGLRLCDLDDVWYDGQVYLWDAATGRRLFTMPRRHLGASDVAVNPRGTLLAALVGNDVIVWDFGTP